MCSCVKMRLIIVSIPTCQLKTSTLHNTYKLYYIMYDTISLATWRYTLCSLTLSSFFLSTAKYLNSGSLAKSEDIFTHWTQRGEIEDKPRLEPLLQLNREIKTHMYNCSYGIGSLLFQRTLEFIFHFFPSICYSVDQNRQTSVCPFGCSSVRLFGFTQ